MADYERFDTHWDIARRFGEQGNAIGEANNYSQALAIGRAGLAEEPAAWVPRIGVIQMHIERSSPPPELRTASEEATRAVIAYARAGADDDPALEELLFRELNSFSMQLEQEGRDEESLALAEEHLERLERYAESADHRSQLAHTRGRTAELRLGAGDAAGAQELADALVDDERRYGTDPDKGASGLPSWLRLRARALAALGRGAEARSEFEASLQWSRDRVRAGMLVADLDLADALDEYAAFLTAMDAADDARAASDEAARIRAERKSR